MWSKCSQSTHCTVTQPPTLCLQLGRRFMLPPAAPEQPLSANPTMQSPDIWLQRALGDNQAQPLVTDEKNQDSKKTGLIQNQHQVMASAEMESQNQTYKA